MTKITQCGPFRTPDGPESFIVVENHFDASVDTMPSGDFVYVLGEHRAISVPVNGYLELEAFEVKLKHVLFFNIYKSDCSTSDTFWAYWYESKEKADKASLVSRIACVRVEFTEGEGL